MKYIFISPLIMLILSLNLVYGQKQTIVDSTKSNPTPNPKEDQIGTNQRFSFIVGLGPSLILSGAENGSKIQNLFGRQLYNLPTINPINNFVKVEEAQLLRTNISLGIVYTPYFRSFKHTKNSPWQTVPYGRTFAAFFNPISLSGITSNQSFFQSVDMGLGYGKRTSGGLLFMGTIEFFSVKQARNWFIEDFKNNNTTYMLEGEVQKAIDYNDINIFYNRVVVTIGFKVCYTFDIVKQYYNEFKKADEATPTPLKSNGLP